MEKQKKITIKFLRIFIGLLFLLLMSSGKCSNDYNFDEFHKLLERANLIFFEPKNYEIVPVIPNNQVHYDIAYKLSNGIEVRYSIIPYDTLLQLYNAYLDRKAKGIKPVDSIKGEYTEIMSDPNNYYKSVFASNIFNICEKTDSSQKDAGKSITEFHTEDVMNEFNADYGNSAWCNLDPEFGQDYKKCSIFIIHKKDCGMVICFRLFRDKKHIKELSYKELGEAYYNLRFYKTNAPFIQHPKNIYRIIKADEY